MRDMGPVWARTLPILGRVTKAPKPIAPAIEAVERGLGLLMKGVLNPLEPLLRELEPLFGRLQSFLRRLLGLAEDEAGALAGTAGKGVTSELNAPKPKPAVHQSGGPAVGSAEGKVVPSSAPKPTPSGGTGGTPDWLEPTAHPPAGDVGARKPRGFQTGRSGPGRNVKPGTLEDLEPTTHDPGRRPRAKGPTREEQLEGIAPKKSSQLARDRFDKLRDGYAKQLGVGKGGDVHHAIELNVLDKYPGSFSEAELNALENMRGVPTEQLGRKQLHNSKIREIWDRHYARLDQEVAAGHLQPGTAEYNDLVRRHLTDGRDEMDYVL